MYRRYVSVFENITIGAAQDLVSLKGTGLFVGRLRRAWFGLCGTTLATAQCVRLNIKKTPATFTAGSGGAASTPRPLTGTTAATITARINDTTPGTTSSAFVSLYPAGIHIYGGYHLNLGDGGPTFGLNEGIVFELLSTVTGTCIFSGGLEFDEMG